MKGYKLRKNIFFWLGCYLLENLNLRYKKKKMNEKEVMYIMNFLINKCFSVLYIFMYMNFILFFVKNLVILN